MLFGKRKGFTLIELLIVISIIGVLVGIILIGLRSVRAKATDVQRKSDVVAIGRTLEGYAMVNNETVPKSSSLLEDLNVGSKLVEFLKAEGVTVPLDPDGSPYRYYSD